MKTVLITGATGAIGSAVTPLFLREPDTNVWLLLRADSEEHLQQRLHTLMRFWRIEKNGPWVASRLVALRGDVCEPRLGLDESTYRKLAAGVTHVVHAAGNVKLNQTLAEARRNALDAARQIVDFVKTCQQHDRFQKVELVSTVGVAGRSRGLVPEEPLPGIRNYHNTYEAAKAEAEAFVLEEIAKGLPATIHRPSMVVGDSRSGEIIHFQVFYHLSEFLTGCRTRGFVPRTGDVKIDIIPVDYVAGVLHEASSRPETIGRIFHLCSGPQYAPSVAEMMERLRDFFGRKGRPLPPLRRLSARWFRACLPLVAWLTPRRTRRALQGLHFFLDYLDEEQVFDNRRTRDFLTSCGIKVPRVQDYLQPIMNYYWIAKHPQSPPKPAAGKGAERNPYTEDRQCSLQASETH